ncbi:hypothetical protein LSAT2_031499 [Lamellibrachia satsuma]|nr:hypothetical protein LSAT2_031499 [Lamellibrachia satsuma]
MSDTGEEANFVRQQGIGKSNRSLLHYHNEETTKVKLKACSVVLTDIFGVGKSVCARKTNVSCDSATANDLCVYSGSNTTISPQKVSAVIPKNIDKEETTELTVNLRGTRDCTHSDEMNDDRPKVNEAEQVVECRIKVKQEKVPEEVSKSDAEDETRSSGQQSIVESHNSLTRDHDGETNKVKLEACSAVPNDIFKVSWSVGNDLQTCCNSPTSISPQKVREHGQISENIDTEETTEFIAKLPDMGDCSEENEDLAKGSASHGSNNPKINPPRKVIVVVKPGTIGREETTRFVVKLCDTRDCTYSNEGNEDYMKENETGNPSLPDVDAEQTMCSPTSVETLPAIDELDSPLNSRASCGSNSPKISPPKKVMAVVKPEPEKVGREETTEFTVKLCETRNCSHSDDANEEFCTMNDTADPDLPDVDAENCEQQTVCSPTSEETLVATKEFDCLLKSNASCGSNNPNISAPRKVIVVVKPGTIGRGETSGFTVKLCDTINDSHSDEASEEQCTVNETEDYGLADDDADKYEEKTVCSSTTVETLGAANEYDIKTDHNYFNNHELAIHHERSHRAHEKTHGIVVKN